jgi:restriction endonuclease S subunit
MNQNPEQLARDKIDAQLIACGWHIQNKSAINLSGGLGIAVREYQTNVGPADYILFVHKKPVGVIEANYLNYFLNSDFAKHYSNSVKPDGANQSNINGQKLKDYPIPLAPLAEQKQIIQEIKSRLSVADKLEETNNTSLQQGEALRQSILKQAFEGKLLVFEK